VRPILASDVVEGVRLQQCVGVPDSRTVTVATPYHPTKEFSVHRVHDMDAADDEVFDAIGRPAVRAVVDSSAAGDRLCAAVITYGQTNTGKTHTWRAVLRRAIDEVFATTDTETTAVCASCLQLHNDQVTDLLPATQAAEGATPPVLPIREDHNHTPARFYVERQQLHVADDARALERLVERATENRCVAMTRMNTESSRSHVLFTLHLLPKRVAARVTTVAAAPAHPKLCIADLAGSERIGRTKVSGDRLAEAQFINGSLSALGNVVHALAAQGPKGTTASHIPFRDSKLTKLLQDFLGQSRSRAFLVLTLSPCAADAGESTSVLKFGERATCIPHRSLPVSRASSRATSRTTSAAASRNTSRHQSPAASRGRSPSPVLATASRARSGSPAARRTGQMAATQQQQVQQQVADLEDRVSMLQSELAESKAREEGLIKLTDALEADVADARAAQAGAEKDAMAAVEQVVTVSARADKIQLEVARVEAAVATRDALLAEREDTERMLRRDNDHLRARLDTAAAETADLTSEVSQLRAALEEERNSKAEILGALRDEAASLPVPRAPSEAMSARAPSPAAVTSLTPESAATFLRAEVQRRTQHVDRLQARVAKLAEDAKAVQTRAHCDVARAIESQRAAQRGAEEQGRAVAEMQRTLDDERAAHTAEVEQLKALLEAAAAKRVSFEAPARVSADRATSEMPKGHGEAASPARTSSGSTNPCEELVRPPVTLLGAVTSLQGHSRTAHFSAPSFHPTCAPAPTSAPALQPRPQDRHADPMSRFAAPDQTVALCRPGGAGGATTGGFGVVSFDNLMPAPGRTNKEN
jgi:kinesin family protein C2/C3